MVVAGRGADGADAIGLVGLGAPAELVKEEYLAIRPGVARARPDLRTKAAADP